MFVAAAKPVSAKSSVIRRVIKTAVRVVPRTMTAMPWMPSGLSRLYRGRRLDHGSVDPSRIRCRNDRGDNIRGDNFNAIGGAVIRVIGRG